MNLPGYIANDIVAGIFEGRSDVAHLVPEAVICTFRKSPSAEESEDEESEENSDFPAPGADSKSRFYLCAIARIAHQKFHVSGQ